MDKENKDNQFGKIISELKGIKKPLLTDIEKLKLKLGDKLGYHLVKDIKDQFQAHKNSKFLALSMDTLFIIDGIKSIESLK